MRSRSPTSRGAFRVSLSLVDSFWAIMAPLIALYIRGAFDIAHDGGFAIALYWIVCTGFSIGAFVAFRIADRAARYFSSRDALEIIKAVSVAEFLTLMVLFSLTRLENIPRATPLIHALVLSSGLIAQRLFTRADEFDLSSSRQAHGIPEHIIIIGSNYLAALYIRLLEFCSAKRRQVIAILDSGSGSVGGRISGVEIVGKSSDLPLVVEEYLEHGIRVDRVIIAGDKEFLPQEDLAEIQKYCEHEQIALQFIPELIGLEASPADGLDNALLPKRVPSITLPAYFRVKRFLDVTGALVLGFLVGPMFLLVSLAVLLDVGSPVFFWQQRIGKDGRRFYLNKFRTLRPPFDGQGRPISAEDRCSKLGRLIRRLRLDELPQLLNVLIGEMSLIGPRALLLIDQPSDPTIRLMVRPGIAGWAQVNGGARLTREEKNRLDEWYVRHASLALDIRIVFKTLGVIFLGLDVTDGFADALSASNKKAGADRADRRLIFVNRYYYPDHAATSQILTAVAAHLAASGRDVHIITSRLHYQNPIGKRRPAREMIHGVHVHRVRSSQLGNYALVGRMFDYLSFYLSSWREMISLADAGDIIIANTDPPLLSVLGMWAAERRGASLVNWLQDLYPEVAASLGVPFLKGRIGRAVCRIRDRSLASAVANVVVGNLMKDRVVSRGISASAVHVIPNFGFAEEISAISPDDNPLRKEWGLQNKFVVGYSGNLGRPYEFETLLAAAEQLKAVSDLVFLFIGGGKQFDELARRVKVAGLSSLFRFVPYQKATLLKFSLSVPDVHWLSLRPELEGLIVPSKFYGIAAAHRPTIAITAKDGEIAQLVEKYDCGVVVTPGDGAHLAHTILHLSKNPILRLAMGQRARKMLEANFSQESALLKWEQLLSKLEPTEAGAHVKDTTDSYGLSRPA